MSNNCDDIFQVTFSELKQFETADIAFCISKNAAQRISCNSCASGEASFAEVLSLWLKKLLPAYAKELNVKDWESLLSWLYELATSLTSLKNVADYKLYLGDSLEFATWAQQFFKEQNVAASVIINFLLKMVNDFFTFEEKCENKTLLEPANLNIHKLHQINLNIINDTLNNLEVLPSMGTDDAAAQMLNKWIKPLCLVGKQLQSSSNIRLVIEHWKCVGAICNTYITYHVPSTAGSPIQFLTEPLNCLFLEVRSILATVYREDTFQEPIDKIEKFLRISNYYIQLLRQIIEASSEMIEHSVFEMFFNTILNMHNQPNEIKNTEKANLVEQYVHTELNSLLELVFQKESLLQVLIEYVATCREESLCFAIVKDFLDAAIESETKFTSFTCQTLIDLFEILFKDTHYYINENTCDTLIKWYATLTCLDRTDTLYDFFRNTVINSNFILSHVSTDVLLICMSINADVFEDEALLQELQYWQKVNNTFTLLSTNAAKFQVQRLLRKSYEICQEDNTISEQDLQQICNSKSLEKFRFLQCVGIGSVAHKIGDNLCQLASKLLTEDCTVDKYYELILCLKLTAWSTVSHSQRLLQNLITICTLIMETQKQRPHSNCFQSFIDAFFGFMMTTSYPKKLFLLEQISKYENLMTTSFGSCWYIVKFLYTCIDLVTSTRTAVAAQLLQKFDKNVPCAIVHKTLNAVASCKDVKKVPCSYQNLSCTMNIKKCSNCSSDYMQQPNKRSRLVEPTPVNILEQTVELNKCLDKLNAQDMSTLRQAVKNLTNLIENKQ